MIEVYDNFFPKEIHEEVFEKLMEPGWRFRGGSLRNTFWHHDGLEQQDYFADFLYRKICERLNKTFKSVKRIYANGQTACQCGNPHRDDGDLTFLYYPPLVWDPKWQGHLIFPESERVVFYKPNRAVLFTGKQLHYADAPSRFFNGLRISLAYKLIT